VTRGCPTPSPAHPRDIVPIPTPYPQIVSPSLSPL